jgi:hypothetical protein
MKPLMFLAGAIATSATLACVVPVRAQQFKVCQSTFAFARLLLATRSRATTSKSRVTAP